MVQIKKLTKAVYYKENIRKMLRAMSDLNNNFLNAYKSCLFQMKFSLQVQTISNL